MADLNVAVAIIGDDKLSQPARAAANALAGLEKAAHGANGAVAAAGAAASTAARGVSLLATGLATGLLGVGAALAAVGTAAVGFNARMEQTQIAFTTLLKNADDAAAFVQELQTLAATTPFEMEQVLTGARNLLAMGFAAREVKPLLIDLGNVAAGLGLSGEQMEHIALVLGQIQATGRVLAGDLLQLSQMGVPVARVFEVMAEQTGKTVPELKKLQEQSLLTSDVFVRAFRTVAQTDFAGAMERQSRSFLGSLSTIKDNLLILAGTAFRPLFDRISELAQRLAAFVQSDQFVEWGARIGAAVEVILEGLDVLVAGFGDALGAVLAVVTDVGKLIYEALMWLNPFATHSPSLVSQVEDGVAAINSSFSDLQQAKTPIDATALSLEQLRDALAAAKDESRAYKDAIREAEGAIQDLARAQLTGEQAFSDASFAYDQKINQMQLAMNRAKLAGAGKGTLDAMAKGLERVRLQAENVRLEERLKFDPLHRAIDKLANPKTEKSFADVVQGIKQNQEALQQLRPAAAAAEQRESALEAALKNAEKAHRGAAGAVGALGSAAGGAKGLLDGLHDSVAKGREQIEAYKQKFEEFKKDWQDLGPIRRAWDAAFGEGAFDGLIADLGKVRGELEKIAAALKDAPAQVLAFGEAWKLAMPKTMTALEQIGPTIAALAADLSKLDEQTKMRWDFSGIKGAADPVLAWLIGAFDTTLRAARQFAGEFRDIIVPDFQRAMEWLGQTFAVTMLSLDGAMHRFSAAVVGWGADIIDGIVKGLSSLASDVQRELTSQIGKIKVDVGPFHLSASGFTIDAPSLPSPFGGSSASVKPGPGGPQYIPPSSRGPQAGFQHGGSFYVGGAGGADSQLVAFRATPGERVDVTPPGRGAGGVSVHVNLGGVTVTGQGDEERLVARLVAELENALTDGLRAARTSGTRFPLGVRGPA